jgi:hypothetical protein
MLLPLKSINNYMRRSSTALAPKMLMKLTPQHYSLMCFAPIKNRRIVYVSTTTVARGKIRADFALELNLFFGVTFTKLANN